MKLKLEDILESTFNYLDIQPKYIPNGKLAGWVETRGLTYVCLEFEGDRGKTWVVVEIDETLSINKLRTFAQRDFALENFCNWVLGKEHPMFS